MNNKIANFSKFYSAEISSLGPTKTQSESLKASYRFLFTDNIFYENLYINVPLEEKLLEEIDGPPGRIVALCGPAGCGKSTVSIKVKKELERDDRNLVFFFDMRIQHASKSYDEEDEEVPTEINKKELRELMLGKFKDLFPINDGKRDELVFFLISPEQGDRKKRDNQTYLKFSEEIDEISRFYRQTGAKQANSFRNWFFSSNTIESEEYTNIERSVSNKLDITDYLAFIRHKKLYEKVIIWLDNIDAFSNEQQIYIANFLRDIHKPISNTCQLVISVREENIYRIGYFHESRSEPVISKVSFEENVEEDEAVDAINVPVITRENLKLLIRKKIDFASIVFHNLSAQKKSGQKILGNYKGISFDEGYELSDEELKDIVTFSEKLIDCFDGEKIIFLSNNSIRDYLRIHANFLEYIVTNRKNEITDLYQGSINGERYIDWKITTEFLSWIHSIAEPFRLETFNVLHETVKYKNKNTEGIGCFLPYLILTRIWNEGLARKDNPIPNNNPHLSFIIEEIMQNFKYPKDEILEAINKLYQRSYTGRNNFIVFRKKQKIESPKELESLDTTVRITYRGKVIIGNIINSFGYLSECCKIDFDKSQTIEGNVIKQIKEIARVHLESLQKIRNNNFSEQNNWLNDYLLKYGVPLEPDFVRSVNLGKLSKKIKFQDYNRALYLGTVFAPLSNYFSYRHKPKLRRLLNAIEKKFHSYLEELDEGKAFESFDL